MRADAAPSTQTLRGWQRRALVKYLAAKPRDFLAVATIGGCYRHDETHRETPAERDLARQYERC